MWLFSKSKSNASSRRQIQMKEVRDGILVLPNNEYRIVIETSSVNFELKSEEEQDVIIDGFQTFLNSLPCPLQILIRVREVDIDQYVDRIAQSKDSEKEKVYKSQIDNYCSFIKNLVSGNEQALPSGNRILSRHFYVVIPHHHTDRNKDFTLIREQINLNKDIVMRGVEKLGMKARVLDSLELLDLFYSFYNPQQAKAQPLQKHTIGDTHYV